MYELPSSFLVYTTDAEPSDWLDTVGSVQVVLKAMRETEVVVACTENMGLSQRTIVSTLSIEMRLCCCPKGHDCKLYLNDSGSKRT